MILLYLSMLLYYFNSIKVRLKHLQTVKYGTGIIFQFHKGTIKTLSSLATSKDEPISIP